MSPKVFYLQYADFILSKFISLTKAMSVQDDVQAMIWFDWLFL